MHDLTEYYERMELVKCMIPCKVDGKCTLRVIAKATAVAMQRRSSAAKERIRSASENRARVVQCKCHFKS